MKVKCVSNMLTSEQQNILEGTLKHPDWFSTITPEKEYTVLGITFVKDSSYMNGVTLEICSDVDMIETVPICLFEIIDTRASQYWSVQFKDNTFSLWPKEFYKEFFHDDLTEGIPEIVQIFKCIVGRMEREFVN